MEGFDKMNKIIIFVILYLLFYSISFGYTQNTHNDFSDISINYSVLKKDPTYLTNLDLPSIDTIKNFVNQKGDKATIRELIQDGSRFEDDDDRSVNHFFDPYNDRPLTIYPFQNFRSPDWILSDIGVLDDQVYSMRYANEYFYSALTLQSEDQRDVNFGKLFETIGHMIHHIQDMAQPEHVRNDDHCDDFLCFFVFLYDPSLFEAHAEKSFFEEYTDRRLKSNGLDLSADQYSQYAIPRFETARAYWHTATGDQSLATGTGMAEFTNRNFISEDTNFRGTLQSIEPDPEYPSPNGTHASLTVVPITDDTLLGPVGPDQPLEGNITFIGTPVFDANSGVTATNPRTSSLSIFTEDLKDFGYEEVFNINRFTIDAALEFLIPRAIAYSAGLIDFVFRGRLGVESIKEAVDFELGQPVYEVLVRNESQGAIALENGAFEIYYDSLDGMRKSLQIFKGADVLSGSLKIENGQTRLLQVAIPEDRNPAKPLVLAYRGKIGQEQGIAGTLFDPGSPLYVLDIETSMVTAYGPDGSYIGVTVPRGGRIGLSSFQNDHYTASAGAVFKNGSVLDTNIENPNDTSITRTMLMAADVTGPRGDVVLLHRYDLAGNEIATDAINPGYGMLGGEVHVAANDTHIATTHSEHLLIYDNDLVLLHVSGDLSIFSQEVAITRERIYVMNGGTVEVYDFQGNFIGPATQDVHWWFPCLAATETRLYVVETEWQSTGPRKNTIHIYATNLERNSQGEIINENYQFLKSVDISAVTSQPRSCSVDRSRVLSN